MNSATVTRLKIQKPRWIIANLLETTEAAAGRVISIGGSVKKTGNGSELTRRRGSDYVSKFSSSAKFRRDVFGATILPSNLSFDNMKKLSMNQIKLDEIPVVDVSEGSDAAEAGKINTARDAEEGKEIPSRKREGTTDIGTTEMKKDKLKNDLREMGTDSFEDIPGPRWFESFTSYLKCATRHTTVHFLLRLLRNGSIEPFRKYGPIVRLPEIMGGKILILNRKEDILEIHEQDRRHPESSSLDALECSRLRRHGKKRKCSGISESDWEKTRQAINALIARNEEKYFEGLEESGSHLVRRIRTVKNRENEVTEDFDREINKWSLDCLFHMLFDKSPDFLNPDMTKWPSKKSQLLASLRAATLSLNICESGFQFWRLMSTSASTSLDNSCQSIENLLSDYVYQCQNDLMNKDHNDVLTVTEMMLRDGMTKTGVITVLSDAMLIGMNAMTNTLAFLLYHLAKNPKVQTEVLQEIREILPEKYSRLEYDHLPSLRYLAACLRETLRLRMPIPIMTRYLSRDVIISNFHVPRGTFVVMASQADALREENFEESRKFRPRRWLQIKNKQSRPSIALSDYSSSFFETRLAEISLMACVGQIVRNFKVEFNHGQLTATSPLSYPTKSLKFNFLER